MQKTRQREHDRTYNLTHKGTQVAENLSGQSRVRKHTATEFARRILFMKEKQSKKRVLDGPRAFPGSLPRFCPRFSPGPGGHNYHNTLRTCVRLVILCESIWMWFSRNWPLLSARACSCKFLVLDLSSLCSESPLRK
jgi:hypothetical protein